jgi:hypothetical protein
MADYTPVAVPGSTYTFQASGTVAGGDLVGMSGPLTVTRVSSAASLAFVGVAGTDAAIGAKVTVFIGKMINDSVAEGTVASGDQLVSSSVANRQVKALAVVNVNVNATFSDTEVETALNTAVNQARGVLGVAVSAATDNQTVRWVQR